MSWLVKRPVSAGQFHKCDLIGSKINSLIGFHCLFVKDKLSRAKFTLATFPTIQMQFYIPTQSWHKILQNRAVILGAVCQKIEMLVLSLMYIKKKKLMLILKTRMFASWSHANLPSKSIVWKSIDRSLGNSDRKN